MLLPISILWLLFDLICCLGDENVKNRMEISFFHVFIAMGTVIPGKKCMVGNQVHHFSGMSCTDSVACSCFYGIARRFYCIGFPL